MAGVEGDQFKGLHMPGLVEVPKQAIDELTVTFDMEVKAAESIESSSDKNVESDGSVKMGFNPFGAKVNIKGSILCREKNTGSKDNSAKYHVNLHDKDFVKPEGLERMLEILATARTPDAITSSGNGDTK